MSYRVLLVGGGSGGHIYPLIAVAESLRKKAQEKNVRLRLQMMGSGSFMAEAARESNIVFTDIISGKLRRYASSKNFSDILKLPFGLIQAMWHMFWYMPDVVFAKGGHASVLPVLAARFFWIPVYIHETDSVAGLSNRLLSKRAKKIFVSFASTSESLGSEKTILVGNPVRPEILSAERNESLGYFGFDPNRKTIFITGGSQGSLAINNVILSTLVQFVQAGYQIIHQCGDSQLDTVKAEVDKIINEGRNSYGPLVATQYKLFPFMNVKQLAAAYAAADVMISRAGGAIFEMAMIGKPVILIPLPGSAGDHQLKNALEFVDAGAILIEEQNLTSHILLNSIQSVLDPQVYGSTCEKIKSFAKPDAADRIADELLS